MLSARDGSPFDCQLCSSVDREIRNCFNRTGLSESARAVEAYTGEVTREIKEKNASKVFSLGSLRLYECPLSYLTWDTREIMRAVFLINGSGHLMCGNGWGAEPYWLVEAFEIFKAEGLNLKKDMDHGK